VLSPNFPADAEPDSDDLLDVEEWDGESWRRVGQITHGELVNRRDM
jgi:hypothetical protein